MKSALTLLMIVSVLSAFFTKTSTGHTQRIAVFAAANHAERGGRFILYSFFRCADLLSG